MLTLAHTIIGRNGKNTRKIDRKIEKSRNTLIPLPPSRETQDMSHFFAVGSADSCDGRMSKKTPCHSIKLERK